MTDLHCAGCGCPGRTPTIVYDKANAPPGELLVPVFGWHQDGRPALLCPSCRARFRGRSRRRYGRDPGQRHLTK